MTLYVARHGETEFNRQRRFTGSIDAPLSETGLQQADELAQRLKSDGVHLDAIVSSSMRRALATAGVVADAYGLPVETADEFVERNMGVYEGLTFEECETRCPDMFERGASREWDDAPDGGETLRQLDERVLRGLERVLADHSGQDVLIVCHGGVVMMINKRLNNLDLEGMFNCKRDNCGVNAFQIA
ncbi:MAG: histidine phosphatase family protein [Oscillospiraceae bacterium]|jgi:probable phosphoglycerate mutase|nr:histidine phosphatase family protein [Oscillospiraceae bacterium]